jgi:hypothetical protein
MAHYAFLNDDNVVTDVIVGKDENDLVDGVISWEIFYQELRGQKCLRTSYNTRGGKHLDGGEPFRGNYAGIGFSYDEALDAFIPPRPNEGEWVLDPKTYLWVQNEVE